LDSKEVVKNANFDKIDNKYKSKESYEENLIGKLLGSITTRTSNKMPK
jgi:hypothetical protein